MSITFNPYRTTRAARRYVSPRTRPLNQFERETRGLSYMLKDPACPEAALQIAAAEMAALVWGPCRPSANASTSRLSVPQPLRRAKQSSRC